MSHRELAVSASTDRWMDAPMRKLYGLTDEEIRSEEGETNEVPRHGWRPWVSQKQKGVK